MTLEGDRDHLRPIDVKNSPLSTRNRYVWTGENDSNVACVQPTPLPLEKIREGPLLLLFLRGGGGRLYTGYSNTAKCG